jgi:MoxR-like ATPase
MNMIATQSGLAKCRICGIEAHWLGDHLVNEHDLSLDGYLVQYPEATTGKRKEATVEGLSLKFAGVTFPVDIEVPASACLPMPAHYTVPTHGPLARDVQDVAVAVKKCRSIWVWGAPGVGKDAAVSALCAMTRRPSLLFSVVQGADLQSWKFTRSFDAQGTKWEEGVLLKALRDGYLTGSGRRVPYLIILSDFDRATRQQAEELRQILDSIQGRISGPTGEIYPVFPGTTIVATANSSGAGDTTGRCISSNPIDASILDRFERKIQFHSMDLRDEEPIAKAKFPLLAERAPNAISTMMRATFAVREGVEKEEVYCEWSHRTVCSWASAAEDLLEILPRTVALEVLLKRAARVVLDGMPDADTRENVKRIMDPHIKGGLVNEGDTSHISDRPLTDGW